MKLLLRFLAPAALLLAVASAASNPTITGLVASLGGPLDTNNSDFDILLALLTQANLTDTLDDPHTPYTVFAPSDAAFLTTVKDLGFKDVTTEADAVDALTAVAGAVQGQDPAALISALLQYHVVPGSLDSKAVLATKSLTTVQGSAITRGADGADPLALVDLAPALQDPLIVKKDIAASNGFVHVINRVLFNIPASPELVAGVSADAADDGDDAAASGEAEASAEASGENGGGDNVCFPASAVVHVYGGGEVAMADLAAGHVVRASVDVHSPVYLFTHRQLTGMHEFVRIEAESGHVITLSANHYLYANSKLSAADSVRVGDVLETLDGRSKVVKVGAVLEEGLVAPHTLHGDLVVNGVRASSYTRVVHPTVAHFLLAPVRALVQFGVATEPLGALLYNGADRLARLMPKGN
jgi:uncharacterized surface protein with fasciclin (FAS1) repeats